MPKNKAVDNIIKEIQKETTNDNDGLMPKLPNLTPDPGFDLNDALEMDMLRCKYENFCVLFPHKDFPKLKKDISKKELEDRVEYCKISANLATNAVSDTSCYIIDNFSKVIEKIIPAFTGLKLDGLAEEMKNDPNIGLTLRVLLVENLQYIQISPPVKLAGLILFSIVKTAIQNLMINPPSEDKTKEIKERYKDL